MEQQSYWVQTTDQQRLYVKTWGNANIAARDCVYHLDWNWCDRVFLGGDFYFR